LHVKPIPEPSQWYLEWEWAGCHIATTITSYHAVNQAVKVE